MMSGLASCQCSTLTTSTLHLKHFPHIITPKAGQVYCTNPLCIHASVVKPTMKIQLSIHTEYSLLCLNSEICVMSYSHKPLARHLEDP